MSNLAGQAQPVPFGFEVGQRVPNLVLPTLGDTQPRSIADFQGQKLILHIFASW